MFSIPRKIFLNLTCGKIIEDYLVLLTKKIALNSIRVTLFS